MHLQHGYIWYSSSGHIKVCTIQESIIYLNKLSNQVSVDNSAVTHVAVCLTSVIIICTAAQDRHVNVLLGEKDVPKL